MLHQINSLVKPNFCPIITLLNFTPHFQVKSVLQGLTTGDPIPRQDYCKVLPKNYSVRFETVASAKVQCQLIYHKDTIPKECTSKWSTFNLQFNCELFSESIHLSLFTLINLTLRFLFKLPC